MTTASQRLGRGAERAAADYLVARGFRVLAVNQRVGRGELDIIARCAGVLAFVEVKARRSAAFGAPEDAVWLRKRAQIARLADLWLTTHPWALAHVTEVRFDIIAVDMSGGVAEVRHLPGAFTADG